MSLNFLILLNAFSSCRPASWSILILTSKRLVIQHGCMYMISNIISNEKFFLEDYFTYVCRLNTWSDSYTRMCNLRVWIKWPVWGIVWVYFVGQHFFLNAWYHLWRLRLQLALHLVRVQSQQGAGSSCMTQAISFNWQVSPNTKNSKENFSVPSCSSEQIQKHLVINTHSAFQVLKQGTTSATEFSALKWDFENVRAG